MKMTLKLILSTFLLIGLAACSQQNSSAVSNSTTTTTAQVSEKSTGETSNQVPVTFVRDKDGDTVVIRYKNSQDGDTTKDITVRMLLIDTPEDVKPNTCVQPFGLDAAARTRQLLSSGNVTIEYDGNKSDKYGRLLAYVFVNGKTVQETLLSEGYARVAYVYASHYKYLDQFKAAEAVAKSKGLNIWTKKGYATDRGFIGCVSDKGTTHVNTSTQSSSSANKGKEYFANCTLLRQKYPDGVKKGQTAYREQLDRNKDGVACEK
jgi:micrococcal nuclease